MKFDPVMVDALSRLFGKSSKKPGSGTPHSPSADRSVPGGGSGSTSDPNISEDEGFTVVGGAGGGSNRNSVVFPNNPPSQQPQPYPSGTMNSQTSLTGTSFEAFKIRKFL